MQKFTVLTGVAAPLMRPNINTDVLIRIERMMYLPRGKLGPYCFEAWRYREDGSEDPDFVLNRPAYRGSTILLAGDNFGCGSSREPAVWSLSEMGYRCVIAPSFGDIFFNNCFQTGMLPIVLPAHEVDRLFGLAAEPAGLTLAIDLAAQTVTPEGGAPLSFDVDPDRKHRLLNGLDDIGLTLEHEPAIAAFEARRPARIDTLRLA